MPTISYFYGITIAMFWNEGAHGTPHFHAEHAGKVASIGFDGRVLEGKLARRDLSRIRQWTSLHADELHANWERARRLEPLEPIDPLA